MNYQREVLTPELYVEMYPLLEEHWAEVAHYKDIKLNPDIELYLSIQDKGMLRLFTARKENGELVGYNLFFIKHNGHYKQSLNASQDIIFVRKTQRGFGLKFIEWCDDQLRIEGIDVVYHHVKAAHNFGPKLEKQGYELVDLIYAKKLKAEG